MNILLLNNNPVVSRLVSLCLRDTEIVLDEVSRIGDITGTSYDIAFIDDASYDSEVTAFLGAMQIGKIVFFSSRESGEEIGTGFDTVIKKPFLPSQIQQIIESVRSSAKESSPDGSVDEQTLLEVGEVSLEAKEETSSNPFLFPLSEEENETVEAEENMMSEDRDASENLEIPKVLDHSEIEQIKALLEEEDEKIEPVDISDEEAYEARKIEAITKKLEEDGLEIVEEEEILSELSKKPKKKKTKSKKKNRKKKQKKEEIYTMEEALLAAIENMKPKKIKKLLKGADVTIKIRFKDDV